MIAAAGARAAQFVRSFPQGNGYAESFSGRRRDAMPNETGFWSLGHASELLAEWRENYNGRRPHMSLAGLTPKRVCNPVPTEPKPERTPLINE